MYFLVGKQVMWPADDMVGGAAWRGMRDLPASTDGSAMAETCVLEGSGSCYVRWEVAAEDEPPVVARDGEGGTDHYH